MQRRRILVVTALAVVLLSGLAAFVLAGRPESCAEPMRCVSRIGGTGCLPGPCGVAEHRAGLQAAGAMVVGLVLGGLLIGLGYRPDDSPGV